MDKYKLIFRGQLKEGKNQAVIGKFLCKFLAIAETNAAKLFSGRAYALKSNLPQQQAYDLQGKLDQAGILTDVIREKPLQNDVTYQEKVIQTEQGRERVAEPDYKMLVGDKTLCRHCGSHLTDFLPELQQFVISQPENAPLNSQSVRQHQKGVKIKTKLRQNEHVIKQGAANLQKGIETVGGKLYLTNQRLVFEAHMVNIQGGTTEINLTDIQSSKKCWTKFLGLIPLMPNSLAVYTNTNKEYRFVLFGRGTWAMEIESAKNS